MPSRWLDLVALSADKKAQAKSYRPGRETRAGKAGIDAGEHRLCTAIFFSVFRYEQVRAVISVVWAEVDDQLP